MSITDPQLPTSNYTFCLPNATNVLYTTNSAARYCDTK